MHTPCARAAMLAAAMFFCLPWALPAHAEGWDPAEAFGGAIPPNIITACGDAWPGEPALQRACEKAERNAMGQTVVLWSRLDDLPPVLKGVEPRNAIVRLCATEWFAHGGNMARRLTLACMQEEATAYRTIVRMVGRDTALQPRASKCLTEWSGDAMTFRMTLGCLEE